MAKTFAVLGQSNANNWFYFDSVESSLPGNRQWRNGYDESWVDISGMGAVRFANAMAEQLGEPINLISSVTGGLPILEEANPNKYWIGSSGPNNYLEKFFSFWDSLNLETLDGVILIAGERDASSRVVSSEEFYNGLAEFSERLNEYIGQAMPFRIAELGTHPNSNTYWDSIRSAQHQFAEDHDFATLFTADVSTERTVHYSGAGYYQMASAAAGLDSIAPLVVGTIEAEVISGNEASDFIAGDEGDDTIHGEDGDDFLFGERGQDRLYGDKGDDFLHGGDEADFISGGKGHDKIFGDLGRDRLKGEAGNDQIYGGKDNDIIYGGAGDDSLHGESERDVLWGGDGNDSLKGGEAKDFLFGEAGNDRIDGNGGADELIGGRGSEIIIRGQAGNDILIGVEPSDLMPGMGERDRMLGGVGADTFVIGDVTSVFYLGNGNNDYGDIRDFDITENDLIQLNGSSADYKLQVFDDGTRIFYDNKGNNDLVAIATGISFDDFSSGFNFI